MNLKRFGLIAVAYVSFWCAVALAEGTFDSTVSDSALSGGQTSVFNSSRDAFAKPTANLPTEDLRDFTFGNKIFNTKWVTAPASVASLDGLGPTFNRSSCSACHFKDGRGRPPIAGELYMKSMLMRLSVPGIAEDGGPKGHEIYGTQLSNNAINGVPAEGYTRITYEEISGTYDDGMTYRLRKPSYEFVDLGYGPLGDDILFSPRVAPAVHGMGLLEAIPEEIILSLADANDENGDGISGRPNMVWDAVKGKQALGRFGWKANVATLRQQDAAAAQGDAGVTTSLFPEQNCTPAQKECLAAIDGGTPEMSDKQLEKMTFYVSTLAVPARRDVDVQDVIAGARLFEKASCVACHAPQLRTGKHEVAALSDQDIQPFTDLLLHDMGEELSDNRPDYQASGSEWRTPPLWGVGLVKTVNKHSFFLHDGRARNLEEAVLWHGGEAAKSRDMFKAMSADERQALIAFLNSL